MTNKTNKSIILTGVKAVMANWNADFDGQPKQRLDGTFYASPFALKYAIKDYWKEKGLPVMGTPTFKPDVAGGFTASTQEARFNSLFPDIVKKAGKIEVLSHFMKPLDLRTFGVVATKPENFGFKGVVQVSDGINVYKDTQAYMDDLTAPYASKEGVAQTTIGKRSFIDFGLYNYSIIVNPSHLSVFNTLLPEDEKIEYTEDDYFNLKDGLRNAVSNLNSLPKMGCSNSYTLVIELKEDSSFISAELTNLVQVSKDLENDKTILDFKRVQDFLNSYAHKIESYVLYADTFTQDIVNWDSEIEVL